MVFGNFLKMMLILASKSAPRTFATLENAKRTLTHQWRPIDGGGKVIDTPEKRVNVPPGVSCKTNTRTLNLHVKSDHVYHF